MARFCNAALLASAILGVSATLGSAQAALITSADLFAPLLPVGTTNTIVGVQGVSTPSQTTLSRPGYTISFNVADNQGIVQGSIPSSIHAVPVAGITPGGQATYLTGDFGSAQTTNPDESGNFLSTGTGRITVTFDQAQISLALLWGSIDSSNLVTFGNTAGDTLSGSQVQALAAGFAGNGFQGPRGSAYVVAVSDSPFTSVTFSSGVTSFELASIVASVGQISTVPLPASAPMFGAALMGLAAMGYAAKRKKTAAA